MRVMGEVRSAVSLGIVYGRRSFQETKAKAFKVSKRVEYVVCLFNYCLVRFLAIIFLGILFFTKLLRLPMKVRSFGRFSFFFFSFHPVVSWHFHAAMKNCVKIVQGGETIAVNLKLSPSRWASLASSATVLQFAIEIEPQPEPRARNQ